MKRKTKNTIITLGAVVIAFGLSGAGSALLTNGFKDFKMFGIDQVIDNSRIAVTSKGSKGTSWVSTYVYFTHPELEEEKQVKTWPGMMAKELVDEVDYVTYQGNNDYTIELTHLMPLKYTNFEKFFKDGGTCGVVLSYETESGRIQSADYMITESGNHYLPLPTENEEEIKATKIEKFTHYGFVSNSKTSDQKSDEEKESSTKDTSSQASSEVSSDDE